MYLSIYCYLFTVVANYRWLMPHLAGNTIPSASEIFVQKDVGDMDGGLALDGERGWLEIKDFDPCLIDPSECHHGFSMSFKLKLDQVIFILLITISNVGANMAKVFDASLLIFCNNYSMEN